VGSGGREQSSVEKRDEMDKEKIKLADPGRDWGFPSSALGVSRSFVPLLSYLPIPTMSVLSGCTSTRTSAVSCVVPLLVFPCWLARRLVVVASVMESDHFTQ
jgi:hypothetical protein